MITRMRSTEVVDSKLWVTLMIGRSAVVAPRSVFPITPGAAAGGSGGSHAAFRSLPGRATNIWTDHAITCCHRLNCSYFLSGNYWVETNVQIRGNSYCTITNNCGVLKTSFAFYYADALLLLVWFKLKMALYFLCLYNIGESLRRLQSFGA